MTQQKSYLYSSKYSIIEFTVAEEIICVLEDKAIDSAQGPTKIVAQLANESFDRSDIVIGYRISNCSNN